ncbi:MAG: hypothetical protein LUC33_00700 [Prevotellaceae bacterium]|nr:hypothetical protein [Prevotellaceae bacterium]
MKDFMRERQALVCDIASKLFENAAADLVRASWREKDIDEEAQRMARNALDCAETLVAEMWDRYRLEHSAPSMGVAGRGKEADV